MLSLKIKCYPLPGLRGENAWTTVSCLEYGCHLGGEQRKCREISSQNFNCEPTWWPDMLLYKAINTGSIDLQGKKRKRSTRKPLNCWFTKRQSPVKSQTIQFTTKSLSSQASQHVQRCSGISLDHLFIKKLQPNSLFLKDYFSVQGCRVQKNAVKQMKSAWTTMTVKGRA